MLSGFHLDLERMGREALETVRKKTLLRRFAEKGSRGIHCAEGGGVVRGRFQCGSWVNMPICDGRGGRGGRKSVSRKSPIPTHESEMPHP